MIEFSNHKMGYAIFQDWNANRGSLKSQFVMILFRMAKLFKSNIILTIVFCWYLLLYRVSVEWLLNIGINWNVNVSKGFRLIRGYGSVISGDTIIGENCTIRHFTTITNKVAEDGSS
ncbi:MAG: serine acetyltransferase, partial [Pedobacter sp.]